MVTEVTRTHHYEVEINWTGNTGSGTTGYRDYSRDHDVSGVGIPGKPAIPGTADPAFRGLAERWNPEELLVASLAQCHMLWYLALCGGAGVVVTEYTDRPSGAMAETPDGSGSFTEVVLRPTVVIATADRLDEATALHHKAHKMCFIANSVNFPVRNIPTVKLA
jgi:organic hydroperoxide reductase OsmC/OhrA